MLERSLVSAQSPDPTEPAVRARFCHEWLALIAKEEDPYRARFFERLTAEMRAQIDGASRVAWLPIALHVRLADIQLESFGVARAHDYYRRAFVSAIKGPVFASLFVTAARVMGMSPAAFVRWASRGYEAAFRNVGRLEGEVLGPGRARLTFLELPAVCTASDAWVMSTQGSTYGVYDILEMEGVVRLDTRARAEGKMVLELEWGDKLGS
jgi:hypothetical protein